MVPYMSIFALIFYHFITFFRSKNCIFPLSCKFNLIQLTFFGLTRHWNSLPLLLQPRRCPRVPQEALDVDLTALHCKEMQFVPLFPLRYSDSYTIFSLTMAQDSPIRVHNGMLHSGLVHPECTEAGMLQYAPYCPLHNGI